MHDKILIAKTSLDGHWRGIAVVARAFRDAGYEVVVGGMMRASEISRAALDEDVDAIGLNVGGRIEVVERILDRLDEDGLGALPVLAGGTIPPQHVERLERRGVSVHPPGSSLDSIVEAARTMIEARRR